MTESLGRSELNSRVEEESESWSTRQYENDDAFSWEEREMAPPPRPIKPAAPTKRPSLSWPQPIGKLGMELEFPNDSVSVASSPVVNEPSPYLT